MLFILSRLFLFIGLCGEQTRLKTVASGCVYGKWPLSGTAYNGIHCPHCTSRAVPCRALHYIGLYCKSRCFRSVHIFAYFAYIGLGYCGCVLVQSSYAYEEALYILALESLISVRFTSRKNWHIAGELLHDHRCARILLQEHVFLC